MLVPKPTPLEQAKNLTLEILYLIEYGDKENPETYKKLGVDIEKLDSLRLDIIKTLYVKRGK